jgi:hypothetical protein
MWVVVGAGVSAAPLDGRVELPAPQTAPQTGVQMPVDPQSDDVAAPGPVRSEVYTYDPEHRLDPFVSLPTRGGDPRPLNERPAGLAGLSVTDVSLHGLVVNEGVYVAVMQGPDNKTYILRGGELIFDGVVKSVSAEGITFLQEVNDLLSIVNGREVFRTVCGQEERC